MDYDVIIVGAGHNGLVASFYLARAGLNVLVLEAKGMIGGSCVTEELIPGYRFSSCANALWALRPKIAKDLALNERGLKVESRLALRLLQDGRYLLTGSLTHGDAAVELLNVQNEIAKFSAADAAAYPRWREFTTRITRIFGPHLLEKPPRLHEIYAGCTDPDDKKVLDAIMTNSIADLADRFFESDVMRDVGVGADIGDPHDVGSGLLFALMTAMGEYTETGAAVDNGFVQGGMGRLTQLMGQAVSEQGVVIRTHAAVTRILIESGKTSGVELASGETVRSRVVISNLDPKRTFLSLFAASDLDYRFLDRVRHLQTHVAAGLKFHCALSELPEFRVVGGLTEQQTRNALFFIAPNRAYRIAAWRAAAVGDLPAEPIVSGSFPSLFDPPLAPNGRYTMSAYVLWAPVRPRRGTWSERRAEMAECLIRMMDRYTINFRRSLIDYVLLTPSDLEQRNFLTDGNIHHVDGIPSQLLWQRPMEELAHYRAPIAGVYLCGAGTHPWGEVSGAPGHNAAHVVLADMGKG